MQPRSAIVATHGQPSAPDALDGILRTLATGIAALLPGRDVRSVALLPLGMHAKAPSRIASALREHTRRQAA